jgi:adenylate cyclase
VSEAALGAVRDWIVSYGATGSDAAELLEGTSERLLAAGLPLLRTHLSFPTLDRLKRSENIVWMRGEGATREILSHQEFEGAYLRSPFPEMANSGRLIRRWRLDGPESSEGYPMIEQQRLLGVTDLVVRLTPFGGNIGALVGTAISAATGAPGGFTDAEVASLSAVVPVMGLAVYRIVLSDVIEGVLGAYIGHDAGRHVLSGQIRAGEGNQVMAALLLADLRGFTAATEREGPAMIERLGEHLRAIAEPVETAGGEVLKFLGDGLLAAFPVMGDPSAACDAALAAAREALSLNASVNEAHPETPRLDLDIALHLGEVFYGNIGAGSRLEFTVIGPAVNEAARLESLCGRLDRALLMSESFAERCTAPVASLGRFELRGVSGEREVFAPE